MVGSNGTDDVVETIKAVYPWLIVTMCSVLVFAIFGNTCILVSYHWLKRPITPNLKLCISLAAADAWAALLMVAGLVVNSYLSRIVQVSGNGLKCYTLLLEMIRVSALLTGAWHLFALACNHYLGIFFPLKYKVCVTSRRFRCLLVTLWSAPLLLNTVYSIAEQDGFSGGCGQTFYFKFEYRLLIFLLFVVPLVATACIYIAVMIKLSLTKQTYGSENHQVLRRSVTMSTNSRGETSTETRRTQRRNVRTVSTTMLIAVSFLVAWLPCVSLFMLVCRTCPVVYRRDISEMTSLVLASVFNTLVMLKLALNPFIYTLRMTQIQMALADLKRLLVDMLLLRLVRNRVSACSCSSATRVSSSTDATSAR